MWPGPRLLLQPSTALHYILDSGFLFFSEQADLTSASRPLILSFPTFQPLLPQYSSKVTSSKRPPLLSLLYRGWAPQNPTLPLLAMSLWKSYLIFLCISLSAKQGCWQHQQHQQNLAIVIIYSQSHPCLGPCFKPLFRSSQFSSLFETILFQ
jgi:hypothetical protein